MREISQDPESLVTRDRILKAAEFFFSEKGFEATSIRDITSEAGCNIAAVNYHFGSKEKLYETLFRTTLSRLTELRVQRITEVAERKDPPPSIEDVLDAFVRSFLEPLLNPTEGPRFIRILQWEMLHPVLPKSLFSEEMIQPTMEASVYALKNACPGLQSPHLQLCMMSVVGQVFHLVHMQGFFRDMKPEIIARLDLETLIRHVVTFSSAGIRRFTETC